VPPWIAKVAAELTTPTAASVQQAHDPIAGDDAEAEGRRSAFHRNLRGEQRRREQPDRRERHALDVPQGGRSRTGFRDLPAGRDSDGKPAEYPTRGGSPWHRPAGYAKITGLMV